MYKIYNNIEDKIIFEGNDNEFINFMLMIYKENEDSGQEFFSIMGIGDAIEYLENFCGNLDLIN